MIKTLHLGVKLIIPLCHHYATSSYAPHLLWSKPVSCCLSSPEQNIYYTVNHKNVTFYF